MKVMQEIFLLAVAIGAGTGAAMETTQSIAVIVGVVVTVLVTLTGGVWKLANAAGRIARGVPRHEHRLNDHGKRLNVLDKLEESPYNEFE